MRWLPISMLLVGLAAPALAQDDLNVLDKKDAGGTPRKMTHSYLLGQAKNQFDARRAAIAAIKTPEEFQQRQRELRAKFIEAIGGFPEKTDLKPQVVGKEERDGYRIEKLIYESRPNHHVTATLYLPAGKGPFPAVLNPIGHSSNGKAASYIQLGCILLAKNGIAALAYDPIGQGERSQLLDEQGKPGVKSSTSEHTLTHVGAVLVGRGTASYRIWDGIRSIDYLVSRPEIDAKKIGCTGCSGGGTMTSYLMALDERIYCAAPSCYVTSLERLFETIGPQDGEQNITGQVAFGLEHVDYLNLRAPRPTLICASSQDFFDIQGTWTTFREAKLNYGLLGHSERVDLVETPTKHGFPKGQREAMLRWMMRWLLDKDEARAEPEIKLAKDADLLCTRSGQVIEDLKGKSVFQLSAERAAELKKLRTKANRPPDVLLGEVRKLIALPEEIKPVKPQVRGKLEREGYVVHKLLFETEPGILVPALRFEPAKVDGDKPLVVYLHEAGKSSDAAPGGPIEKLVKDGHVVLAIDPRNTGETAPSTLPAKPGLFGNDWKETFISLHLARPLLGQKTFDVLSVLKGVEARKLAIVGVGASAPVALHAAAFEPRIGQVTLERPVASWEAVVNTPLNYNNLSNAVPNALAVYDLPELAATLAPRSLTIKGVVSPALEPMSQKEVEAVYAPTRAAFNGKNLILQGK
ncbi:MAG: acetylxylan esterase [Gemmataceae bacterium]